MGGLFFLIRFLIIDVAELHKPDAFSGVRGRNPISDSAYDLRVASLRRIGGAATRLVRLTRNLPWDHHNPNFPSSLHLIAERICTTIYSSIFMIHSGYLPSDNRRRAHRSRSLIRSASKYISVEDETTPLPPLDHYRDLVTAMHFVCSMTSK